MERGENRERGTAIETKLAAAIARGLSSTAFLKLLQAPAATLLLKKSSDIARPSLSEMRGSQPSRARAFVMSGQRRAGSSSGRASRHISLLEPRSEERRVGKE